MSGSIKLKVRKGKSKDKRYDYYPEWYIEVTDEDDNNKKVILSPSWKQIKNLIKDVKIHEIRIDKYRDRKDDADNWMREITNASKELQTEIQHFEEENIPDIYKKQKLTK